MKRVIVALSGGVDSAVAAALLQQQGYRVEGVYMKNWTPESLQSLTDCPWEQDQADAEAVCLQLGIPFRSVNFEAEYRQRVVEYFLAEYQAGRTPNPDVLCNKEIKFRAFLEHSMALGADYIATGHYARAENRRLIRGVDPNKDQSYFLYTLNKEQLSQTLFPLGELQKSRVRALAAQFHLPVARKKDSQGICFIGHIDLKRFLASQLAYQPGPVFLRDNNIGRHNGVQFYTIGERAGRVINNGQYRKLNNNREVPPLFVVGKDITRNILYVTERRDDPAFRREFLEIEGWCGDVPLTLPALGQIRYQQKELTPIGKIERIGERVRVEAAPGCYFWTVAPGQSLVVYDSSNQSVLGGGIIAE